MQVACKLCKLHSIYPSWMQVMQVACKCVQLACKCTGACRLLHALLKTVPWTGMQGREIIVIVWSVHASWCKLEGNLHERYKSHFLSEFASLEEMCIYIFATSFAMVGFHFVTGWFKLIAPNSFRVHCLRHYWEIDPEISHVFNVPLPRLFCHLFFREIVGFLYFWEIWFLRDPTFPAKKKSTHKHTCITGSAGAH